MNIDYTIGDDIVSIKSHSGGAHKENQTFVCKGLLPCECNCCEYKVNIGKQSQNNAGDFVRCAGCGVRSIREDNIQWFNATSFKKLDTLVNISELTEVLNEPIFNLNQTT